MNPTLWITILLIFPLVFPVTIDLFKTKQTGEGTYYGGNDSGGSCGIWPLPDFANSMTRIALNNEQYVGGNVSQGCGMCLTMYGTGVGSGANPITGPIYAFVNNKCPECVAGDIDVGTSGDGRWDIYWTANDCPVGSTYLQYLFQGSNDYYLKLQVRNHRVPVFKLEFKGGSTWYAGSRTDDNFWLTPSGYPYPVVWPLEVRVTSVSGESVSDSISGLSSSVLDGQKKVQLSSISSSSGSPPPPSNPTPTPTAPKPTPTAPKPTPTSPTPTPTAPKPTPTAPKPTPTAPKPTAPTPTPTAPKPTPTTPSSGCKCTIPGCTVADKLIEYVVSGVTVTKAQVQCGGSTYYTCTAVSGTTGKYTCTASATCTSPIPYINDQACPITLSTASQSCASSSSSNTWWWEFTPPGSGWSASLANIKCSDGRYFACPNNYGTKVGCAITDRECTSASYYYNNAACPIASSLVDDGQASNDGTTPTSAIIGICVALFVLIAVVFVLIILKKQQNAEREEIV